MRDRPKRYTMNDFNLGDEGELRRGSLEKNDGIVVPFGIKDEVARTLGWIPSVVKMQLLGKNVRFALDWRAPWRHETGLARLFSGLYVGELPLGIRSIDVPPGWRLRRCTRIDAYELAPWWYFVARDVRSWYRRLSERVEMSALTHEAAWVELEYNAPSGWHPPRLRWWPAQRWGP